MNKKPKMKIKLNYHQMKKNFYTKKNSSKFNEFHKNLSNPKKNNLFKI